MTALTSPPPGGTPPSLRVDGPEAAAALLAARLRPSARLVAAAALLWTMALAASLAWNVVNQINQTFALATREARANFDKDQAFRLWATQHGGVYVPATDSTLPNPFLSHVLERDVTTPSGKLLTLMNPAYMVRQMTEQYGALYGVKGHITSLKPYNPDNQPDDWERQALAAFGDGTTEVFEIADLDGQPYLRLMRPMITEEGCLKCHAHQGYRVGDVRGGIGVAVPMAPYEELQRQSMWVNGLTHGGIWLLGLAGIAVTGRRTRRRIQEQVRDEIEIRRLHHRNQLILESAADGICGLDSDGRIIFLNQAAARLLRGDAAVMMGQVLWDMVGPADGDSFRRLDGTRFQVESLRTPIVENGETLGTVVTFRDVTDQRADDDRLRQKTEELERSNSDLEQFAYVASHDLREPLRMITSYLQLLKRRYAERLDKDADEFIAFAVDGAQRMDRLIQDLLSYSRVERKGAPFEVVPADRAVAAALKILGPSLQQADASVDVGPLPTVWVDETQLVSLFQNLIGNAVKYRDPARRPDIRVAAERRERLWEFTVSDNGIGIDPQYNDRIFQIFQRLHHAAEYEGSGIGLALCKKIVERHHGRIWVDSAPGHGSTFHFTLPAA